jgi:hypothetical protein
MDRRCPPKASSTTCLTSSAVFHHHYLHFRSCCFDHPDMVPSRPELVADCRSPFSKIDCLRPTMHLAQGCSTFPTTLPSTSLVLLCPNLRLVGAMHLIGVLLVNYSDSFRFFDLAVACLDFVVLVSKSCPCQVVLAVGARLHPEHPVRDAVKAAPGVAVAAVACPTGHLSLHLGHLWAVLVLVAVKMRIASELPAGLLGRVEAIAEMVCPFLCSMRAARGRCGSRLRCRRRLRCSGAVVAGSGTVMWYS